SALRRALAAGGFDPCVVDMAAVPRPVVARRVELGTMARFTTRAGEVHAVPWSEVRLLLRATGIVVGEETESHTTRGFSASRALISGGLLLTKKTTHTTTRSTEEWSSHLIVHRDFGPPLSVPEAEVLFDGPGQPVQPTRQATFAFIIERLRAAAPQATYDDRLQRRAGLLQLLGRTLPPETHLDVALAVLAAGLA
ncbi:MAG: hypothetical protein KC549_13650, partial [Myxococcales bacterium]|nr:hypothetical protein [Myxococcales bacterium]